MLLHRHGLLRAGEREQVENDYARGMGIRVITCDESERFLSALAGVTEPEAKRKIIGREFIRSFEAAQKQVIEEVGAAGGEVKFLVQGTLYPDVVESGGGEGAANIKSHHNVGGLPEDMPSSGRASAYPLQGRGARGWPRAGPARLPG